MRPTTLITMAQRSSQRSAFCRQKNQHKRLSTNRLAAPGHSEDRILSRQVRVSTEPARRLALSSLTMRLRITGASDSLAHLLLGAAPLMSVLVGLRQE